MRVRWWLIRHAPKRLVSSAARFMLWWRRPPTVYRCVECGQEFGSIRRMNKHVGNCDVAKTSIGRKRTKRFMKKQRKVKRGAVAP